jgi:hypothetical protein
MYEYLYIRIAPRGMYQMFQPFRIGVAVAAHTNDCQLRIGTLDASHDRDDSAVKGCEAVRIQIIRYLAVTTYTRACHQIFQLDLAGAD